MADADVVDVEIQRGRERLRLGDGHCGSACGAAVCNDQPR